MLFFFACVVALVAGYAIYGRWLERVVGAAPDRATPAYTHGDGVDFSPMPTWKVYTIQLLNIAGIGPIFGPILGALYGPQALIWVVVGAIFGGAVHDFLSGMMSIRSNGASLPEVVGDALGLPARYVMRCVSVFLMVLVGVVFVLSPAQLLSTLTGVSATRLGLAIFVYYFFATIVPIHMLIGRVYPFFGLLLIFMTLGVGGGMLLSGRPILPNLDFAANIHPDGVPLWPLLFIVVSCGAISGFHSTQCPMMARCLKSEGRARLVFYGGMIMESLIALIWVTVGLSFYQSPEALQAVVAQGSPSAVVNEVARTLLGPIGGALAILGVIVLPITTGDTAFRGARLILAESFHLNQKTIIRRLMLATPLFIIGFCVSQVDFDILWRYFGWANQVLAMLVFWAGAVWLVHQGRARYHWVSSVPAVFMTAVISTFILNASIGFNVPYRASVVAGATLALAAMGVFLYRTHRWTRMAGEGGQVGRDLQP